MTSAYSAVSVSQLPVMVAKDMGFFEKNGLDVDLQYIATAENAAAAVLSGQVQIVLNTQDALISADLHGADLVLIAAGTGKLIFSFDSVPSVTKVEELKGKRIGVTKVGSATDVAARYVLGQHGLQPNDVTIVGVGGVPEILSALTAGAIDAGMLSPPTSFGAPAAGLRELVDFTKLDFQYYAGGVTARRSWLQANPDTAVRYLRAFNEAVQLIHTDSGKAEQVLAKYTKQNDPAILHDSLALLQNGISEDQHPLPATLKSTLDELSQTDPAAKSARPEQFIDTTYLDKALAQP